MNDSSSGNSSGDHRDVPSEIRKLIFKCCDDVLTAEEVLALQQELRSNPKARKAYLEAVHLHIDLDSYSETIRICNETFLEFPESSGSESESSLSEDKDNTDVISWFSSRYATAMGYAASVLAIGMCLGCGLGIVAASVIYRQHDFRPIPWNRPVANDAVARVVSTYEAEWQDAESPETLPTRSLHLGDQIRLKQGIMGISFRSGAAVVLEGPCVFEIRSPVGGKLYTGKACVSASVESKGFAIESAGNIVQISSGQLGVVNDEKLGVASFALVGEARVRSLDQSEESPDRYLQISEGQAVRLSSAGEWQKMSAADSQFYRDVPRPFFDKFEGDTIYLGNLFDDSISSTLTSSLATDGFQAAAETIDLGVAAVRDGGLDVDFHLVDGGVQFNLQNVGGGAPRVRGLPSNDTYRSTHATSISTKGTPILSQEENGEKQEEGIGMSANEMLTFDLDEIRSAGSLNGLPMRFVADRAGINDFHEQPNVRISEARMVVIVSSETEVIATYLNGEEFEFEENASVHSFKLDPENLPGRLLRNGTFVKFDVPLPQHARFLTLATVMCSSEHDDHTVFSGARLEIVRDSSPSSSEPSLAATD